MPKNPPKALKVVITLIVVVIALLVIRQIYEKRSKNPWTRDGLVQAQVVQVAPRVSAPVVKLAVQDNQLVKAGDLLFELDPRTFEAELEQAEAQLELTKSNNQALDQQVIAATAGVNSAKASVTQAQSSIKEATATIVKNESQLKRQQELFPENATSKRSVESAQANYDVSVEQRNTALAGLTQAEAALAQAEANVAAARASRGAEGDTNANLRSARAALREAELNLEFTKVRASVDGYVTNLNLRTGSQAVANQAMLALVDSQSFWVHGFFKETQIANVKAGDRTEVTLLTYPDQALTGTVESIGWGIAQQDGSPGTDLLPNVNPSFDWIRLAQRIPVRIKLDALPAGVELRVGTTASVKIRTDD
jgi:multidrug resistance efflux pump